MSNRDLFWMKKLKNQVLFILIVSLIVGMGGCAKAPQDKAEVVIWHWMTDRKQPLNELAEKYTDETGIKVEFKLFAPSGIYSQKVRAATQAGTLPDIFGILGQKKDFAIFVKAGHVLNLTSAMEARENEWKNKFFSKALIVNEFKEGNEFDVPPGIYGAPIDVTNIQMLYNKALFKQAGLDPEKSPRTFEEFIAAGKKLKAAGIGGFVSGWGETWIIDCLASNFAFNIMGEEKVMRTYKGEVPYTDPDWIAVFSLFKEMRDAGVLATGIVSMNNKDAEQNFANERYAFAFNGSWCVNVYQGMNPDLDYGAMFVPQASNEYPMLIWGGAGSSFKINARSKNKEKAVEFLKWLTDEEQQAYLAQATNNLPANKLSLGEISPILSQFAQRMENTTHPDIWPAHESSPVVEAFDIGLQSIVLGSKTPEEVARQVQEVKEREMSKQTQ
ncbi:MAG: extracellular solute-binding protein [Candidatus Omnitrophica bacterium]|nr:extracellular solute-binding protein [Candidatus Omnitrophota bacterium]